MGRKKGATIKDVAAMAQVSVATVSRVLNNAEYPVSAELRVRVTEAAKALDFVLSTSVARRKPREAQGDKFIAFVTPTVSNPFYTLTLQGIGDVCQEKGYQLILCNSRRKEQEELRILGELAAARIRGVILSSMSENGRNLSKYIAKGMVFVQLDQSSEDDGCHHIDYDAGLGASIALGHLREKGHSRIALASTPLTRRTRKIVYRTYAAFMAEHGVSKVDDLVFINDASGDTPASSNELAAGEQAARDFVAARCDATAVVCANDMLAFGLISGFHRLGVRVPEDVSVIGFDDIAFSATFLPALTTVRYASYEMGRLSAIVLIDKLQNGKDSQTLNMRLEPALVERDTVRDLTGPGPGREG